MALPDCCAAAEKRLIDAGFEAAKAHVKAMREHTDGKHVDFTPASPATASKK